MTTSEERERRKKAMQAEMYALHPEYFKVFSMDVQLKTENAIHVVSLHVGIWRCSCPHTSEEPSSQESCGHIIATQKLLSSAFDPFSSLAPTNRQIPYKVMKLAAAMNVNPTVMYKILGSEPIARQEAKEVLDILSQLTEKDYSLETVDVALLD